MRPRKITIAPDALDANGICESQTPAAGGVQTLTINGDLATAGVATMDVARRIGITSAADETSRTFTVTGTDRYGNAISEAVAGVDTAVASTVLNFLTVTSVTVDDDTAGAITVGTTGALESAWIPVSRFADSWTLEGVLSTGGSLSWGVEYAVEKLQDDGQSEATRFQEGDAAAITHATLSGETGSQSGVQETPVTGFRVAIASYVSGSLDFHIVER